MIERAILLSAGQGRRLLPLTAQTPKCLLDIAGRSLIGWQVEMLARCGIRHIVVVTGFEAARVEDHLRDIAEPRVTIETLRNPEHRTTENLASCWIARAAMDRDFLLLNGDTLVCEAVVRRVLAPTAWPVCVTTDRKDAYDADDMKVACDPAGRLLRVGKDLPRAETNAESIGLLAFRGTGPQRFVAAMAEALARPQGATHWFLKVIDDLAATGAVGTCAIPGLEWCEVDFPADLAAARLLGHSWN